MKSDQALFDPRHPNSSSKNLAVCALVAIIWLLWIGNCGAEPAVLDQASSLEVSGHFSQAASVLAIALENKSLPASDREELQFELDRLRRIKLDFPFTQSALFDELAKCVKGLTREEYEQWVREGRFDSREIDGQRFFMAASISNLFFRYPELSPRRLPLKSNAELEARHWEACEAIKKAATTEKRPYVLPKRFRVSMKVSAEAGAAPDGEIIRAWIPVPRLYPFQQEFSLISSSSTPKNIDQELSPIRSVYLEQTARAGKSTEFEVQYEYMTRGVWFDIAPTEVKSARLGLPGLEQFTQEGPHVQFTPQIRALSHQIGAGEKNPCLLAQKFYQWISTNIKYSFAIEYSTIRNISEYCRARGYGDCGQEALLFITLCRFNGIPARWQSGWNLFPGAKSNHDWTEIYLAPYGWIPVDPYMGIYATRYANTLTPAKRRDLRDFYFGGLDQYRMIANSDHNQPLRPRKETMRSDNVDFQRGELEWNGHNIYFDQFSYELTAKELAPPSGKVE